MSTKRIGILTGGGDVPGLNSAIKTVVYSGSEIGAEVTGIRRGWEGLTHVNFEDPSSVSRYILPLNRQNTRTIDRTGGTWLHSSRTNPLKMQKVPDFLSGETFASSENTKKGVTSTVFDMTPRVLKNIERLGLDYLVAIGGDDTRVDQTPSWMAVLVFLYPLVCAHPSDRIPDEEAALGARAQLT